MPGRLPKSVSPMSPLLLVITDAVSGDPQPFDVPLVDTRGSEQSQGSVRVKLGFIKPQNAQLLREFADIFSEIVTRSRPSVFSTPPVSHSSRSSLFSLSVHGVFAPAFRLRALAQYDLARIAQFSRTD